GSKRNFNFGVGFYNGYSFPLTLMKLKIFQEGTATTGEIDSIHVYADLDTNGLFDPADDRLVESIAAVAAAQTIGGLSIELEPGRISYVYVVYDLPLTVTDSVTVDFKMFDPEDFSVLPKSTEIEGEFPINSPGVDVVDGMVAAQVAMTTAPQFRAAPNDSNVLAMLLDIPANGVWPDILDRVRIQNLGTAQDGNDIVGLRLWEEAGGDPNFFDPLLDAPLGVLSWDGSAWTNAVVFDKNIPLAGLRVYVTFSVASAPADGVTFQANIPLNGLGVRSGNDGPIDQILINNAVQTISTDPLISSINVDRSRYNVGQTVTVTMNLRNEGTDTLFVVSAVPLVSNGTGGVTPVSGPLPAQVDLPPSTSTDLVWTYIASATGDVDFCGFAQTADSITVSKQTCSSTFVIQSRADSIAAVLSNFAPATANRGQDNVSMFRLSLDYASFDSASAPVKFDGITLRIEDDTGSPVPPNSLLDRVAFVGTDGSNNLFSVVDSTGNPLRLVTATPVVLVPGDSVTILVNVDIDAGAAFTPFRMAIASLPDIRVTDVNDGGAVPLANSDGFPWTTTNLFVNLPAESLLVDTDPDSTIYVNSGQESVEAMVMRAHNPGGANTASVTLTDLTLSFFDSTGMALVPGDVIKKLVLTSGTQTLFADENIPIASNQFNAHFGTPLVVTAGSIETIQVLCDVRSIPAIDAFYFQVSTPADIVARDINTEQLLVVAAQSPAVLDFPLRSHALRFQSPATGLVVGATDRLPPSILPSTQNVSVLDLVLTHPDSVASSLTMDSLAVEFVGTAGAPVFPGDLFAALRIMHGSDTLSLVTSLSSTEPFVECVFRQPLQVAPAVSETLSIWVDVKALFSPTTVEVRIAQSHLRVLDANDGSRVFGVVGPFPLVAGPTSMQLPSDRVALGVTSLVPANLATQTPGVNAFDLMVQNSNPPGSTPIKLDSIAIEVQTLQGSVLDANGLFSSAHLRRAGTLLTNGQVTAGGVVFALADSAIIVAPTDTDTLRVTVDVDAQTDNLTFRFVVRDDQSVSARDAVTNGQVLGTTIGGTGFPLMSNSAHILGVSTDAAFTNYPNPFSPGAEATRITYFVQTPSHVTLKLYTMWGGPVMTLVEQRNVAPGLHQDVSWDGKNDEGDLVNNGVYYLVLEMRGTDGKKTRVQRKIGVIR
ncbi:MAG: hypothetical protein OEN01_07205, partial [Candidatus Krumholzibacteria bacterium]|nr:hypothetical protein [Candidatus Krumholzibacteria bacterium]